MTELSSHALSPIVLDLLLEAVPEGSTVLEIGTGDGTSMIADRFNVISIEHEPEWHVGRSELIHAPLVPVRDIIESNSFHKRFEKASFWYDPIVLSDALADKSYDVIVVDGPDGGAKRAAMWWFYDKLFDTSVPVIVDDIHRQYDWLVAANIGRIKNVDEFKVVYGKNTHSMLALIK